jgi:hypothetical protein
MESADRKQNIFLQMILWHFIEMPREILSGWKNFLLFNLSFFSVVPLFKTLFYPWRRYNLSYGKELNIGKITEAFFSNLIFRLLGALIRTCVIFTGLVAEVFILILGFILFLAWLALPFLLIKSFLFAVDILI